MPNRILKESICTSDEIDQLSAFQETVFYRLIVTCDDFGRMDARPKILASKLFPLKDIRAAQIEDALRALTSAELVTLYTVDGKPFLQMNTWDKHQQRRANSSKYPAPSDGVIADDISCKQMISDDSKCPRESRIENRESRNDIRESRSENKTRARFAAPTVEDVKAYCLERGNHIDAQHFVDYYEANGWRVGKNPMKDWRAAVRSWESREEKPKQKTSNPFLRLIEEGKLNDAE